MENIKYYINIILNMKVVDHIVLLFNLMLLLCFSDLIGLLSA